MRDQEHKFKERQRYEMSFQKLHHANRSPDLYRYLFGKSYNPENIKDNYVRTAYIRRPAIRISGYLWFAYFGRYFVDLSFANDTAIVSVGSDSTMGCCTGSSSAPYETDDQNHIIGTYTDAESDFNYTSFRTLSSSSTTLSSLEPSSPGPSSNPTQIHPAASINLSVEALSPLPPQLKLVVRLFITAPVYLASRMNSSSDLHTGPFTVTVTITNPSTEPTEPPSLSTTTVPE